MMKKVYGLVLLMLLASVTFAGDDNNEELPSSDRRDTPRNPPPLLINDDDGVKLEGFSFTEDGGILPNGDSSAAPALPLPPVTIDDDKDFQTACSFIENDNTAAVEKLRIAFGYPESVFTPAHKKTLLVEMAKKIPTFEWIRGRQVLITAERLLTTYKVQIATAQMALIDQYLTYLESVS